MKRVLAITLGGLLMLSCAAAGLKAPTADNAVQEASGSTACGIAEKFVTDRLKAPSTATFKSCYSSDGDVSPARGGIGTEFTVVSWVDAQNGFGAKLRNHFVAVVRYTGDDADHTSHFRLVSLNFAGDR